MMDRERLTKGQMVMHMSETDMVAFIGDEYKLFCQQAIAKSINSPLSTKTRPPGMDRPRQL